MTYRPDTVLPVPPYTPPDTSAGQGYGAQGDLDAHLAHARSLTLASACATQLDELDEALQRSINILRRVVTRAHQQAHWHETPALRRLSHAGALLEDEARSTFDSIARRIDKIKATGNSAGLAGVPSQGVCQDARKLLTQIEDCAAFCHENILAPLDALSDEERELRRLLALKAQRGLLPSQEARLAQLQEEIERGA